MRHVMTDLETFGQRPGCAIISIGAVEFGPGGISDERAFYDIADSRQANYGLHQDPDTMSWWARQSPEARKALDVSVSGSADDLRDVLLRFAEWLGKEEVCVWGNGADFDNAILAVAYHATGLGGLPWKFWNNRCYRTMKNMKCLQRGDGPVIGPRTTHHNALDDAIVQARHMAEIASFLGIDLA